MVLLPALILKASNAVPPPIAPLKVNVGVPAAVSPALIVRLSVPPFPSMVLEKLMSPYS